MKNLHVSTQDIRAMDQRYRVNFINCLSGYKSANLLGTADVKGHTNLAIVSSVVHLGADPALMGLVTRPRSVERHSVENLSSVGEYTLSHVCASIVEQAHQTSARYLRHQSEFDMTGLTPEWREGFNAPYVAESPLSIGLKLKEIKHIDINNTDFIIGEIQWVVLDAEALQGDGFIDLSHLNTVSVSGLDSYHKSGIGIGRFAYAKPGFNSSS